MEIGHFRLQVIGGNEAANGYVRMDHGKQYSLLLSNTNAQRCEAEVKIDGLEIGMFVLNGYAQMTLERSPKDNGRFTFYKSGTEAAAVAGESAVTVADKGVIQVKFTPEKRREMVIPASLREEKTSVGFRGMSGLESMPPQTYCNVAARSMNAGVTGLSGHSDQQFQTVQGLDLDTLSAVTISLRLVTDSDEPRPLPGRMANRVPEPVG